MNCFASQRIKLYIENRVILNIAGLTRTTLKISIYISIGYTIRLFTNSQTTAQACSQMLGREGCLVDLSTNQHKEPKKDQWTSPWFVVARKNLLASFYAGAGVCAGARAIKVGGTNLIL